MRFISLTKKITLKIRHTNYPQLWIDIKDAIAGNDRDFTEEKLAKSIFLLAIPMVLEMVLESTFAVVDIFFVSKLGADAVSVVGMTESAMTIVYAIGLGIAAATTALVARRTGEKKPKEAADAAMQSIFLAVAVSGFIAVPGIIYAKHFLTLMGSTPEVAQMGMAYPAIAFGSNLIVMLLFIINSVLRSSGDAALSMRVLWVSNGLNLILDPLLIFGFGPIPALGLKGAAIATAIGRGTGVLFQFYLLTRTSHRIKLSRSNFVLKFGIIVQLLRLSVGGILQNLVATSSWIALVRIVATLGTSAVAGYTIAIRIILFVLLPAWGLSNAASTLAGQNLGAMKPERARQSVLYTGYVNASMMLIFSILFFFFDEHLVRLFTTDTEVIRFGTQALWMIGLGLASYGFGMVLIQGFNGSGDTNTPFLINLLCFWFFEIPLAYYLTIMQNSGMSGVCLSVLIAESTMTIIAFFIFRKGKWMQKKV